MVYETIIREMDDFVNSIRICDPAGFTLREFWYPFSIPLEWACKPVTRSWFSDGTLNIQIPL